MTPRQRFLAAVRGETPDMVPVAPLIHCRFAHKILGRTDWRAVFEVHRMIGSVHHRGPIGVGLRFEMPDGWQVQRELIEKAGARKVTRVSMHTPGGTLTSQEVSGFAPDDPIITTWREHLVKGPEDWEIFRSYQKKAMENCRGYSLDMVEEACRVMGEDGVPSVGTACPLASIGAARGMQDMIYDLVDHPHLMKSVWEVLMRQTEKSLEGFLASSSEVAWYDICWATGANLGPELFRKWTQPGIERVVELVHSRPGKYIGLYTLAKVRELIPMWVDAGVDFIETFDPNQGDITLEEANRLYGDRVCLMGNFDCVVLARGTVEDARAETLRCLQEGMEGGGYVMVTGDEVPADAKLDNLKAMVETVQEHGRY